MVSSSPKSNLDIPHPPSADAGSPEHMWMLNVKARLDNGIIFSASKSATQSIPNNTVTKLTWDTLDYDTRGQVDITNNKAIIINPGVYQLQASVLLNVTPATPVTIAAPSPPFAYTLIVGAVSADQPAGTSLNVYDTRLFSANMPIGFVSNIPAVANNATIYWYTVQSIVDATHLKLNEILLAGAHTITAAAPVYGVSPPALSIAATNSLYLYIYKNGVPVASNQLIGLDINTPTLNVFKNINCNRNDYLEVYVKQISGGAQNIVNDISTFFQGKRI